MQGEGRKLFLLKAVPEGEAKPGRKEAFIGKRRRPGKTKDKATMEGLVTIANVGEAGNCCISSFTDGTVCER